MVALLLVLPSLLAVALADRCSEINSAYSQCQLGSICSSCVATEGCEYNLVYSTCTAATNSTTYCRSDDSVCAACSVSASKPTCTGEDGSCVCRSLCSVVTSSSKRCTSNSQSFSMMYVAVAFGALSIMLMLYMQRKCAEKRARARMSLVQRELEARRQQRQREREMLRARRPELALELAAWRDHVELHKPQISNVELETCYYLMLQEKKNELGDGLSDDELKAGGIGAVGSPRYADGHTPYFAMREEYPSNTTTHCADDDSDGELEEHAEIAINVNDADRRPVSK
ncbi:hypothetical protein PHYBOEH_011964 [Phytophthora boehmeriae]|uniref:Membrane-associated protein n=1 Tax=Phytophthora boehmeriae TaxID=109152 RepID=A0A8T1WVN7_9STRA|nr:hypothetical protein PHYBOEH_011964 [Phytophthora boehmeriae]